MAPSFLSLSTGALLSLARCYWRQWDAPEKTALTALNFEERGASVGLQSEAMTAFESEWIAYETLGWWKRWRYRRAHSSFMQQQEEYVRHHLRALVGYLNLTMADLLAPNPPPKEASCEKASQLLQNLITGSVGVVPCKRLPAVLKRPVERLRAKFDRHVFPLNSSMIQSAMEALSLSQNPEDPRAVLPVSLLALRVHQKQKQKQEAVVNLHRYLCLRKTLGNYPLLGRWGRFWRFWRWGQQRPLKKYQQLQSQLTSAPWFTGGLTPEVAMQRAIQYEERIMMTSPPASQESAEPLPFAQHIMAYEQQLEALYQKFADDDSTSWIAAFKIKWNLLLTAYTTEETQYLEDLAQIPNGENRLSPSIFSVLSILHHRERLKTYAYRIIQTLEENISNQMTPGAFRTPLQKLQTQAVNIFYEVCRIWEAYLDQHMSKNVAAIIGPLTNASFLQQPIVEIWLEASQRLANPAAPWVALREISKKLTEERTAFASQDAEESSLGDLRPQLLQEIDACIGQLTERSSTGCQEESTQALSALDQLFKDYSGRLFNARDRKALQEIHDAYHEAMKSYQPIYDHLLAHAQTPAECAPFCSQYKTYIRQFDAEWLGLNTLHHWLENEGFFSLFTALQEVLKGSASFSSLETNAYMRRDSDQDELPFSTSLEALANFIERITAYEKSLTSQEAQALMTLMAQRICMDFGGLGFSVWQQRRQEKGEDPSVSTVPDTGSAWLALLAVFIREASVESPQYTVVDVLECSADEASSMREETRTDQQLMRWNVGAENAKSQTGRNPRPTFPTPKDPFEMARGILHTSIERINTIGIQTLRFQVTVEEMGEPDQKRDLILAPVPLVPTLPKKEIEQVIEEASQALQAMSATQPLAQQKLLVAYCAGMHTKLNLYAEKMLGELATCIEERQAMADEIELENCISRHYHEMEKWHTEFVEQFSAVEKEMQANSLQAVQLNEKLLARERQLADMELMSQEQQRVLQQLAAETRAMGEQVSQQVGALQEALAKTKATSQQQVGALQQVTAETRAMGEQVSQQVGALQEELAETKATSQQQVGALQEELAETKAQMKGMQAMMIQLMARFTSPEGAVPSAVPSVIPSGVVPLMFAVEQPSAVAGVSGSSPVVEVAGGASSDPPIAPVAHPVLPPQAPPPTGPQF